MLSPIVACEKALSYMTRPRNALQNPFPVAFGGAARSAVSQPLSVLTGVYQVPQLSATSTSSILDNKAASPTFMRTVPTNRLDAEAFIVYLKHIGVTHVAILHVRDAYGSEFNRDLMDVSSKENIVVKSAAYDDGDESSIIGALQKLQKTQFHYFVAILTPSEGMQRFILRQASDLGMFGNPDYVWLFGESSNGLTDPYFYESLNSSLESDREYAASLNGAGVIVLEIPVNERFDTALRELGTNKELYNYYVGRHVRTTHQTCSFTILHVVFDIFHPSLLSQNAPEVYDDFIWRPYSFNYFYTAYDAIIALGIGLCNMPDEFPTGPSIVDAVKATEFLGSSGPVSFDSYTGTRAAAGLVFKVVNLLINLDDESIGFEAPKTAYIDIGARNVRVEAPFAYTGGTTVAPPSLPPIESYDYNLLGDGARIVGWTLSGVVILLSVGFGIWTYYSRQKTFMRVAQPLFLGLICAGSVLMASSIIPLSFQELMSQRGLNIACMAIPWLFIMGFATAFSSLFCKLRRLNKVRACN